MSSGDGDVQAEEEKMRWNLFQILEGVSYGRGMKSKVGNLGRQILAQLLHPSCKRAGTFRGGELSILGGN